METEQKKTTLDTILSVWPLNKLRKKTEAELKAEIIALGREIVPELKEVSQSLAYVAQEIECVRKNDFKTKYTAPGTSEPDPWSLYSFHLEESESWPSFTTLGKVVILTDKLRKYRSLLEQGNYHQSRGLAGLADLFASMSLPKKSV